MSNLKDSVKITDEMKERLNHRYGLLDYTVDGNIDETEENSFLDNVCYDFNKSDSTLESLINDNMDTFFEYSFREKLEFAEYIEENIDEFISSCGVSNLRQALNGGIREYLFSQVFSNLGALYKNVIYLKLNAILRNTGEGYNEEMLENSDTVFLNFDSFEVEDMIEEFVSSELDNHLYEKDSCDLYIEFSEFISSKL